MTNQLSRSTLNTVVILSNRRPQRQVFAVGVKKRRTCLCSSLSLQPSLKNKVRHSERSEEPASKSSCSSSVAPRAPIAFPNHVCHAEQPAPPATGLRRWGEEAKDLPLLSPLSPAFLKNNICHSERSEEPASKSSSGSHCRCMQLPSQSAESKRAAHPPLPENNPHGQQTVRTNPTSQRRDRKTKKPGRSQTRARRPVPRAAHRGIRHKSRAQVAHSAPPGGKKRRTKRIITTPNTASFAPATHSPSITYSQYFA